MDNENQVKMSGNPISIQTDSKQMEAGRSLLFYSSIAFLLISIATITVVFFHLRNLLIEEASIQSILIELGLLLLAALLLQYLVSSLIYRRLIGNPLKKIREITLKIAENEAALGEQIPSMQGRELQDLVHSINAMSINLKHYTEDIEARVNDRTRLLEEGSRLVQEVLDTTPNMLCLMNTEIDALNYVNKEFTAFFGTDTEDLIKLGPGYIRGKFHPDDRTRFRDHETAVLSLADQEVIEGDFRLMNAVGGWRWLSFRTIVFQRNSAGKPKLVLYVGQDISDRKETEEKLRYLSIHDQLTGLYNRLYFDEEVARLERGRNYPISVLMADLDNLKQVNDRFGHAQGDDVLRDVSAVIRSCIRGNDVVARIGGDEFAALLPGADTQAADHIVQRIRAAIDRYAHDHPAMPISLSIGVHTILKGDTLSNALRIADERMYQVKQLRKKNIEIVEVKD